MTFGYTPDRPVLSGLSMTVAAGERVALVGPSGSGKSTVLQLLLRFYDPQRGQVTVDGEDLRRITLDSLHGQMAAVFQESFLFAGTIRENIGLGKLGASIDEIRAAARAAEIDEVIAALPDGYDTPVGELGGRLSGGQRQRVAIARAVLRDPAVLLLDEATSALDPGTEAAINATLDRLAAGRMVVLVTHRLASARSADRIVVLDGGRLAESGTHAELLARDGLYAGLWQKQSGIEVSADGQEGRIDPARLAAIPLLAGLDGAQREALARRFVFMRYEAGEIVIREGEVGDRFFVVARGKVEAFVTVGQSEKRLTVLTDGDFFGEVALLFDAPRTASVRALQPSSFLSLAKRDFEELLPGPSRKSAEPWSASAPPARRRGREAWRDRPSERGDTFLFAGDARKGQCHLSGQNSVPAPMKNRSPSRECPQPRFTSTLLLSRTPARIPPLHSSFPKSRRTNERTTEPASTNGPISR